MNEQIAKILSEIAIMLEMQGVEFKPRAYEKASYSIQAMERNVEELYKEGGLKALLQIPGVGASIAEKIEEFIKTGQVKEYEKLKKKVPVNLDELSSIEGVGPKMILKIYKKLHVKGKEDLEKAIREGKLRKIKGFGEKTEQNILRNIEFIKKGSGRFGVGSILPIARKILEKIRKVEGVERAEFAGSIRRWQETIGDLDILVISKEPEIISDYFVKMPEVAIAYSKGTTKCSARLKLGMDADLRVLPPESFGAALQYFTGDKYHNVQLRQMAIKQGYKLNEYGLFGKNKMVAGKTEEEIYEKLGLEWMPPEIRTNRGELEASKEGKLPRLIGFEDLKGDLQMHSEWTDGSATIKEMAEAGKKMRYEYIAITDHTKSLAMVGGLTEKDLLKQMAEIDKIQKKVAGIKILKSAEVNILKDGSLDIDDEALSKLDIVGAAVHSNFNMSEEDMTKRIIRAMENPNIDIIFHPTGRVINKRDAYKLNMEEVFKAAKRTKTVLEIDAYPDRLDLKDEHIRRAIELGIKLSIDTDAHNDTQLRFAEYGIAQARRGWAEAKDVINTKGWKEMLKLLK